MNRSAGFSLIEMMIVVMLVAILGGMGAAVTSTALSLSKTDSGVIALTSALETARNRAIAERRNFEVHFVAPNEIRVVRQEEPIGETVVQTVLLENQLEIHRFPGSPDTGAQFGGTGAVNFTGPTPVMWTSDGSFIDNNGDVVNGTVFIANPDAPETARAVTIFGVTGLMRSWKWAQDHWVE